MATDPRSLFESSRPYKAGFVTDIESESVPPGLSEDVIRLISAKKGEPEWLTEPAIAKKFREAREAAGLPRSVVLYAARHTYGTFVYDATKNLKVVMDSMGHSDVRTTMRYQHPELEQVRIAIDQRNAQRHNSRHREMAVQ